MADGQFPPRGHDHGACVRSALARAETHCRRNGLRLTPVRRRVLELIWQSHRPSGAYQLLEQLATEGHRPSPPTVYRALDFLLTQGLVHRVNSRNAFIGCSQPGNRHLPQLFICARCGVALELADDTIDRRIRRSADTIDFEVVDQAVEVTGICPACHGDTDGA